MVGRCASVAGGAGLRRAAGHAANAGRNPSGAGGLYPIEAWGLASPTLDDDLGLALNVENLGVEQLIVKAGVEALDVAVLPGAAPLDVGGLGTDSLDPFLHRLGAELRSVVGAHVRGNAPHDRQGAPTDDHIEPLELAGETHR